jgi:hypothetical protein
VPRNIAYGIWRWILGVRQRKRPIFDMMVAADHRKSEVAQVNRRLINPDPPLVPVRPAVLANPPDFISGAPEPPE